MDGAITVGTITLNADGSFLFDPAPNYNNSAPVLVATYAASDGSGGTSGTATLKIRVTPVNDPPSVANGLVNDTYTTLEDNAMTLNDVDNGNANYNVLSNDVDADGDILTVTQFSIGGTPTTVTGGGSGSTAIASGTITIFSDGRLTYTPTLNFNGAVPTITYTVSDGTSTGCQT